ncbi:hypothetical protein EGT07_24830 [Herbaspirillum sp. HC18]|nr:hypothetical protein EGT07_24830 [Herbaspirillum sp. HC18]
MDNDLLSQQTYDPNRLLDTLLERLNLKNDAALSRTLGVAPPVISKIRHGRLPVGASMLVRMHEETGLNIRELRDLMGDRRNRLRISNVEGLPKESPPSAAQHPDQANPTQD